MDAKARWRKVKKGRSKLEYRKFRVRGHIKSFRDLEIYKKTTQLSSEIFQIELPRNLKHRPRVQEELATLCTISKYVPKMIAEAYGEKFTNKNSAYAKLERAMQYIDNVVAKLDFLIALLDHQDSKQIFVGLISKYQTQRRKILNLKRAWLRIDEKYANKE